MSNTTTTKKTRGRPAKATRTERPRRIPMSGQRMRMEIPADEKDPNFHYAWISDERGLIHRAKQAGYVHVMQSEFSSFGTKDVDSANSSETAITMPVSSKVTGYLMKQPMEYYLEDRDEANNLVDSREADMKKALNGGQEGQYGKVEFS